MPCLVVLAAAMTQGMQCGIGGICATCTWVALKLALVQEARACYLQQASTPIACLTLLFL